jgi:acyl-CoA thioesterase
LSTSFEQETAVELIAPGRFNATVDKRWWVVRGPHGGYLASIALRAMKEALDERSRHIRSLAIHYFDAPHEGDMTIETTIERSGRSISNVSARMSQDDRAIGMALGVFSVPWAGPEFFDAVPPEIGPIDSAFKVPNEGANIPPFLGNFDMRWAMGAVPYSGSDEAIVGGWFRMEEPQIADDVVVATYMDAWPPVMFPVVTEPIVAPTLDLTIHYRRELPLEAAAPDDYYIGRFHSHMSHEGFFEEDGELWTGDGVLIAQSRQLALSLPIKRE